MARDLKLSNARIILEDQILNGSIVVQDGVIFDIIEGNIPNAEDVEGDFLLPGLVELHTDHLETHYAPRPGVRWNMVSAIQSHDAQISSAGITTVFDCLRMGAEEDQMGFETGEMKELADVLTQCQNEGRLRSEHFIHLRCEVSAANVMEHFEQFDDDPLVRLASLMDHAPGQRQFQTLEQYAIIFKAKRGMSDDEFDSFVRKRQQSSQRYSPGHRDRITAICHDRGISLASHDDATIEHVEEAVGYGISLAEFPTSMNAAKASHEAGLSVLMGAPNVVRGGSHTGNIAAKDLAKAGVLDVLSSDYIPFSLIHAPFVLSDELANVSLPDAIAMVTAIPARSVDLHDRGRIKTGLRADLVRVQRHEGVPVVRSVWREGVRVT